MVDGQEPLPDEPGRLHQGDDAVRRGVRRQHRRRVLRHDARASEDARARRSASAAPQAARRSSPSRRCRACISAEDIRQDNSYLIVAERTNTNGSRQFKRLLQAEDWDGLVSMARDEVRDGSHMLDVCVDFVGRDGVRDMHEVDPPVRQRRSTRRAAHARQHQPRRDGGGPEAGRRAVHPQLDEPGGRRGDASPTSAASPRSTARRSSPAPSTKTSSTRWPAPRERKISIATRIRDLAVASTGCSDEDILFDPLVLPISTGIEEDRRNALETIEGTRLISPAAAASATRSSGCRNVSFGLKPAARVVLEQRLPARAARGRADRRDRARLEDPAAEPHPRRAVGRGDGPDLRPPAGGLRSADAFHLACSPRAPETAAAEGRRDDNLPIEEKLKKHIIDGEKRNLIAHLDEAMKTYTPLEIINDILLEGMKVVGELFGSGQMQLPFVLQSAETMKAAVAHLEPFMEKVEGADQGQDRAGHRQGRRPRHRQEPRRHHPDQQRLHRLQPRHQAAGRTRSSRPASEKKADAIGMSGLLVKSVGGDEGEPGGAERPGRQRAGAARRRGADARLRRGRPGQPVQAARCSTARTRSTGCT